MPDTNILVVYRRQRTPNLETRVGEEVEKHQDMDYGLDQNILVSAALIYY